jgi:hypothetical protein
VIGERTASRDYDAGVPDLAELLKHPAVTLAAGVASVAATRAADAYRICEQLPLVGPPLRRGRADLTQRGAEVIDHAVDPARAVVTAVVVTIVERVLDQIDLTALVRERVDLVGLADEVIDGVDLPAIIRASTSTVTADVMSDVRSQGERADDLVSGFVDRLLGRDRDIP